MGEIVWSFIKRHYKTIIDIVILIAVIWLSFKFANWIFGIATPIVFGAIIYMLIKPMVKLLVAIKIKRGAAIAISLVIYLIAALAVIFFGGMIAVNQVHNLIAKMPHYIDTLKSNFGVEFHHLRRQYTDLPYGIPEKVNEKIGSIGQKFMVYFSKFLWTLVGTVNTSIVFIGNLLLGIILAYFLGKDAEKVRAKFNEIAPNWMKEGWDFLRINVISGITKYITAQLKLMTITFVIIFISLLIFRVNNAFIISILSAVFDILPLLGVATIFVPWIIYLFIVGNTALAIKLLIVYGIVFLVRQLLEPKIVGESLGVSAFIMLSLMVIFLGLFGFWGMLLTPILTILLKELYSQGYFKRWIRME
ncbi:MULTISPECIES: sporulation integral membrane protein YtvI [Heyndrickxia]|uniref:sporulation integral membrane protein YtvI n=1 Tax=Heyndrickxia TaxID=2837504 RepID=UPI0006EC0607|nr:sporulation integral membrane protein YtvI [Heyndrickxia shackletonii]NEY99471.1 sporulation integral membrane protein YtvI [Heyndrickxia shackletonii]